MKCKQKHAPVQKSIFSCGPFKPDWQLALPEAGNSSWHKRSSCPESSGRVRMTWNSGGNIEVRERKCPGNVGSETTRQIDSGLSATKYFFPLCS